MSFTVTMLLGVVALAALAGAAWIRFRRPRQVRLAIADAQARVAERSSRQEFPHRYMGLDSPYGLRRETPCRIVGRRAGNTVRIRTPDGRAWLVRDSTVTRRERAA